MTLQSGQDLAPEPITHDARAMAAQLAQLRSAWENRRPDYAQRMADLSKLRTAVADRAEDLVRAVDQDFSRRSRHETLLADVMMVLEDIKHTQKRLRKWMRSKRVSVDYKAWPASAEIMFQPVGVVGILSPWNYPIQLSLSPLVAAIAAGNHVLLKPSEHTPITSALIAEILTSVFPDTRVQTILGGPEVAQEFSALPFDHLFYTGSTAVGKLVMQAASQHLTPITLELGGKSPAIIAPDFPVAEAAKRIAVMKHLNAGQTCIAPDYVFVADDQIEAFKIAYRAEIHALYPDLANTPDYTSIVNDRQFQRLQGYLTDAIAKGAVVESIAPGGAPVAPSRVFPPTLVSKVSDDMRLMQDEIFGPILPVMPYQSLEAAMQYVKHRPRPLAFYLFDRQRQRTQYLLNQVIAGGVTLNDCALHITQHELPFGGIGPSGMGHYHGHAGFLTFSKQMPVFRQARWSGFWLLKPPFKKLADWAVKFLTRA